MKKLAIIILAVIAAAGISGAAFAQNTDKLATVTFDTNIHCENCAKKIEDSLPFEKGVKDVKIDVPTKKVTVQYDKAKTDAMKLQKAIEKLGYKATVASPGEKK